MQDVISRLAKALGLPVPPTLQRAQQLLPAGFLKGQQIALWSTPNAPATPHILQTLNDAQATVLTPPHTSSAPAGLATKPLFLHKDGQSHTVDALIFDATSADFTTETLHQLHDFFHPMIRSLQRNGRVVLIGRKITSEMSVSQATAQQALEGFMRSIAKEINKRGCSAQLLYITPTDSNTLAGPLRFFLSPQSAYITSQVLTLNTTTPEMPNDFDWSQPLSNRVALITGASRGIGLATAERMAAYGAKVICLDLPSTQSQLESVASNIDGLALPLDITTPSAGKTIEQFVSSHTEGLDIIIHNAGITRDRTLARMSNAWWESCLNVNLHAVEHITTHLIQQDVLRPNGRIICLSSIAGIAGNMGQTNYATAKAGLRGFVRHLSAQPALVKNQITANAIAPGFIETDMTDHMPVMIREVAKRLNSFNQGGLPDDVAQAIAFFASPTQSAITGQTLRVCGGMLIGA